MSDTTDKKYLVTLICMARDNAAVSLISTYGVGWNDPAVVDLPKYRNHLLSLVVCFEQHRAKLTNTTAGDVYHMLRLWRDAMRRSPRTYTHGLVGQFVLGDDPWPYNGRAP